jgi:SHS2 domain-containing protein
MATTAARWEHFPHQADVGVRGIGPTREIAFEQAAMALMAAICDPNSVQPRERIEIECADDDDELLLVDWLNAVIYEMATRRMLFGRFSVAIKPGNRLHAFAWGETINPQRHQAAVEAKGATVTELRVTQTASDSWRAQCVVDV